MNRVLVLGASGMAGHVVALHLKEVGFSVDTLSSTQKFDVNTVLLDVTVTEKLRQFLKLKKYDVVINCIALLVGPSEANKSLAAKLNSELPRFLEDLYKNSGTKVVHISTDGVFSGQHPPYKEGSPYDSNTVYGRTKAQGEIINDKDLTLRLSIFGPTMRADGTGIFNWFYSQKGKIEGYTNVMWNGVSTIELAKGIKAAIEQNITGIYHFVPNETISKFDKLQLFRKVFGRNDIIIKPVKGKAVGTTIVNTRKDFKYKIPSYKIMIEEMKDWIDSHPEIYKHYAKD
jgi:dTDP-4-dehydrorhamnose reductase